MNAMPLEMPLARYVETRLIDRVTHGRHSLLRDVFCSSLSFPPPSPVREPEPGVEASGCIKPDPDANFDSVPLAYPHPPPHPPPSPHKHSHAHEQARDRQHDISPGLARILALPSASSTLAVLRSPLDMAALLRSPEELARASMLEGTGTGKSVEKNANGSADEEDEDEDEREVGDTPPEAQEVDKKENNVLGEREAIERALIWSAKALEALQWRILVGNEVVPGVGSEVVPDANAAVATVAAPGGALKIEGGGEGGIAMDVDVMAPHAPDDDDPLMKRVRLNLIALAKRAPLDKIARLPAALVPESIRGMVPTV